MSRFKKWFMFITYTIVSLIIYFILSATVIIPYLNENVL